MIAKWEYWQYSLFDRQYNKNLRMGETSGGDY